MTRTVTANESARRRAELAKIHIGAGQLLADEEAYRDMLEAVAGARSAKALDADGRRKVLDHLKSCGASFHPARPARPRVRSEPGIEPLLRKVDALCINHPGGRKSREYAEGVLQQMTRTADRAPLEWATPAQLRRVIQALEIDVRRHRRRA